MDAKWYVINTYSGHENKARTNLEHRIQSMNQAPYFEEIVVPTEQVVETKGGEKVQVEKRIFPGYLLVKMILTDDSWSLVKNTPGVTGFVGSENKPTPLMPSEVDRILHTTTVEKPKAKAEFVGGRPGAGGQRTADRLHGRGVRGQHRAEQAQGHGVDLRAGYTDRIGFRAGQEDLGRSDLGDPG